MNKNQKTTSVRFSSATKSKIQWLMEQDRKTSIRMGVKPVSRTRIIEDAIEHYYFKKINDTQDADVVERINELIADQVGAAMSKILQDIEEILFLCIKNDLGNRVFYRSPSVLPAPSSKEQAIEVIINEKSKWDLALEEYMMNKWTREIVHHHEAQDDE